MCERPRPHVRARATRLGVAFAWVMLLAGCGAEPSALIVATHWPASERTRLERAYRDWVRSRELGEGIGGSIVWIVLDPADDVTSLARRRRPPDVLLGGPWDRYVRLGDRRIVARQVARETEVGIVFAPGTAPGQPAHDPEAPVAFDDPRTDPIALTWAYGWLADPVWADGYAEIVRVARDRRHAGTWTGSARAAFERGEAAAAVALQPFPDEPASVRRVTLSKGFLPDAIEGAAIPAGAAHPSEARAFLTFLGEFWPVDPATKRLREEAEDVSTDGLLADLLGATLVETQDELRLAWDTLERAGRPEKAERWMTSPPPWPPASVARMLEREENAMELVETLAAQVTPDADTRSWLLRSWLSPSRPVDGNLLRELGGASGGRLAREPRFRAWLRSEWTAWARQRYRRVARSAEVPAT